MKKRLGVVFLFSLALYAQLSRGVISGTVQDPTGAVVADVKVVITNTATGLSTETVTNGAGLYRFVAVELGNYEAVYSHDGFATNRITGIIVAATQEVVLNQALSLSSTVSEVSVVASSAVVELSKASATVERKLDQVTIQSLPLTGFSRDVNTLALLSPTATRAPVSGQISVNGQRSRNNNFMIDGVDNNDVSITQTANRIIPESISEYQVQNNPYSTEFGRAAGGQINVITSSGGNQVHGALWDYYRGNFMEPVSLLNKRAGLNYTPRFSQNQTGGSVGGHIIKNRTFYFGLFEANIRREAPDARNATAATIPTPTGYAALASLPLRPAAAGTPAQTAASRQSALDVLKFLPSVQAGITTYDNIRNVSVNGAPVQMGTVFIPLANPNDFYYYQARVDHRLTDVDNLSYRFLIDKRNQPDVASNLSFGSRFSAGQLILGQNHSLSETHTFTPRLVNEFRSSFVRRNLNFQENDPLSSTIGITGLGTIGGLANYPQGRIQTSWQFQDVMSYQIGRNALKFGADVRAARLFSNSAFDSKGTWTFNSFSDFLNNLAFQRVLAVNTSSFDATQISQFYFFQDDYKFSKNLTVNVGLRYEYSNIPFGFFGSTLANVQATRVAGPVRPDKNNFAPRAGFAYSPSGTNGLFGKLLGDGKTVFRGGYGLGYDVLFFNLVSATSASNYPRVVSVQDNNLVDQFPLLPARSATVPDFNPLATFAFLPEDSQNPTVHYYSFSVQRSIGQSLITEVGYSGNRSYHGIRQGQWNPSILTPAQAAAVIAAKSTAAIPSVQLRRVAPAYGSRVTLETTAKAQYDALYVRVDKKLSHGLLVGANYTYSGNFSDNDESLGVADITNSSPQVPQDYFNYRNEWSRSIFDRPQRFAIHYVYDLPWFSNTPGLVKRVMGGWQLAGITDFQSGQPFTVRTGADSGGIGTATPARPDLNPNGIITKDPVTGDFRTFTTPLNGTGIFVTTLGTNGLPLGNTKVGGGNLGRNTFRGPGWANWNFTLAKTVAVRERFKVQLRTDWIDGFNHRNFGNPVATMSSSVFGTNSTDPGGRTMLGSLKVQF